MNIELKDNSHGPVYAQVRQEIESQIQGKQIASGEALPSPATLAKKLSVDRGEIQRAYFELERAGLVKKETGKDFLGQAKTTYRVA
ncbi:MAG: GntR family transcriptional regulator [Pyrinomonadaceae bacterium]|nr:GntR family transcriptional regulator [Pyrinomonadaceae bacterium]